MIEMTLAGVRIEVPGNQPIVLLREALGERFLPIWIGQPEAAAIALAQQGVVTPRPMTHDLLKNILDEMAVQVSSIVITELREGTFYASINMQRNGTAYEVSSRPSDAIALAVRLGCKIFATDPRGRGGRGRRGPEVPGVPREREPRGLRVVADPNAGHARRRRGGLASRYSVHRPDAISRSRSRSPTPRCARRAIAPCP
jgi:uncharacterized protein